MIVLDSSYALALVMPDETRPASMAQVLPQRLTAPFIWPVELANAMRNAVRRARLRDLCLELPPEREPQPMHRDAHRTHTQPQITRRLRNLRLRLIPRQKLPQPHK